MRKKEYIKHAKQAILNRIIFHAPVVYDDKVDTSILRQNGIDPKLPIFKFEKELNFNLLKAFVEAAKERPFNLLLSKSYEPLFKKNCKMKNVIFYDSSSNFLEVVNKLNINYTAASNYNLVFRDKFFKINGNILNPKYEDFSLKHLFCEGQVNVNYNEFVLNGSNLFVRFQNKSNEKQKVDIEFNLPLEKGYYFFKRTNRSVLVENLMTKQKRYLNFLCHGAKFSFSNVDGLENSVYACINVRLTINLKPMEKNFVFFNFGDTSFSVKGLKEIVMLQKIAWRKCCEIFNVQIKTKEKKFDYFFNKSLPQKIWINWLNGQVDYELEEKYVMLKKLFVKGSKEYSLVNFKEVGMKEIGIFNGEYYKKILVISGDERFLRVGKTCFYNINGITNHSLKSTEPMAVCFGE